MKWEDFVKACEEEGTVENALLSISAFFRDVVLWYSGFKLGYDWAIRDFYEGGY